MKLRNALLPLAGTLALMALCTALPFFWFALRDRQLDGAVQTAAARPEFLSAAGRENPVARELYYWRERGAADPYALASPADPAGIWAALQPVADTLQSAGVLPASLRSAAETLAAGATASIQDEEGFTSYTLNNDTGHYLTATVTSEGTITAFNADLGIDPGVTSAQALAYYRTLLGLDGFADWEDVQARGYGAPAACYSADAQLYLAANVYHTSLTLSVTSMSPETCAGL